MSANDMFQTFFDEVLKPAITHAVTKAVQEIIIQNNHEQIDVATAARASTNPRRQFTATARRDRRKSASTTPSLAVRCSSSVPR